MGDEVKIHHIDRLKIQAEILLPLMRAFEEEIGVDRARHIAVSALENWLRGIYSGLRETSGANPIDLMAGITSIFGNEALDYEVTTHTPDSLEFNVTRCAYAEFYRGLGESERGFSLVCHLDRAIAEGLGPDLEFKRSQTIMQGATHCDFRYRRLPQRSAPAAQGVEPDVE